MVEQWSPKPYAGGSSPSTLAIRLIVKSLNVTIGVASR